MGGRILTDNRTRKIDRRWLVRAALVTVADALLIAFAYGFVLLMRFDFLFSNIEPDYVDGCVASCLPLVLSSIILMGWRGLYRSIWSFCLGLRAHPCHGGLGL